MGRKDKESGLNERQAIFVRLYIKYDFNAVRAYAEAYGKENTPKTVGKISASAIQLLENTRVQSEIKAVVKEILGHEVDELKVRWVNEIKGLSFSRLSDYLDENQELDLKAVEEKNPGAIQEMISETRFDRNGNKIVSRKFKIRGKDKALELMGKYLEIVDAPKNTLSDILAILNDLDLSKLPEEYLDRLQRNENPLNVIKDLIADRLRNSA
ncbi:terminase small subunit [Leptospira stimsonii]|uniref:terminase small subunit n=1 Tax=Leptospira stimsonii TaxID=2202203 RepID=UPI0014383006|nr:terminase small subunit [Leptospira stimsonii]